MKAFYSNLLRKSSKKDFLIVSSIKNKKSRRKSQKGTKSTLHVILPFAQCCWSGSGWQPFFSSSSWFAYKTVSNAQLVPYFFFFPLFAYSNVLTSWKNNTNVGEFSNIYCVKKVIRNVRPVFLHRKPSPFWCQGQENWHFSNLSSQWCDDMDMGNCCHCIYALSYATNSTAQTQIPNSFKHWKNENEPLAMMIKVLW